MQGENRYRRGKEWARSYRPSEKLWRLKSFYSSIHGPEHASDEWIRSLKANNGGNSGAKSGAEDLRINVVFALGIRDAYE